MKIVGFRILVAEDEIPDQIEQEVRAVMGSTPYELSTVATYDRASAALADTRFDLVLLDIRLKDVLWAGLQVLDSYWNLLSAHNTPVVVYSAKDDVIRALESFASGNGPIWFHNKGAADDHTLRDKIAVLLRRRARHLCETVDATSARALLDSKSRRLCVMIAGTKWSVASLVAPFLYKLPEEGKISREAVIRSLFPGNDLIRVLTYWFKAQQKVICLWPPSPMYGLTPLATYHCGAPTSPMDALMHHSEDHHATYSSAGDVALKDLQVIKLLVTEKVAKYFREYIEAAKCWTGILGGTAEATRRSQFKKTVTFKFGTDVLEVIAAAFKTKTQTVEIGKAFLGKELYCAPDMSTEPPQPSVAVAAKKIAESLSDHVKGEVMIALKADTSVLAASKATVVTMPNLCLIISHQGTPCAPSEEISSWFQARHSLGQAAKLLRGYATWTVLSKSDGVPRSYEAVSGQDCTNPESLWSEFNSDGKATVIHVLRFGMPLFVE